MTNRSRIALFAALAGLMVPVCILTGCFSWSRLMSEPLVSTSYDLRTLPALDSRPEYSVYFRNDSSWPITLVQVKWKEEDRSLGRRASLFATTALIAGKRCRLSIIYCPCDLLIEELSVTGGGKSCQVMSQVRFAVKGDILLTLREDGTVKVTELPEREP